MTKIALIGAGSAQFGRGTLGEIFQSKVLAGCEVALHDINAESLRETLAAAQDFVAAHRLSHRVSATTDRVDALRRADFVVISIEVGDRFELWDQDRTIPQQYGIRQVYGENGGPGGLFHALRITPPILEICADIEHICPDAFVFNYSNPMSRICTTVYRAFPRLRFVGLCHEPTSLERYIPTILGAPYETLRLHAAGLNHFSCLLRAERRDTGEDVYPELRIRARDFFAVLPGSSDYLEYYLKTGRSVHLEGRRDIDTAIAQSARAWTERLLFKFVLEHFDLLPITSDSHFGEYLPWAYDIVDHRGILDFYRYYRGCLAEAVPEIQLTINERLVPIIEGLLADTRHEEAGVNLPNRGLLRELPEFICVETPAVISKDGIGGVAMPPLPPAYAGLLQNQVAVHAMTAEAVLTRSKKAVVQALLVDPLVDRATAVGEMVNVIISAQRKYLSYLQ